MNRNSDEILFDLLVKEATEGLTPDERRELEEMQAGALNKDDSFELTAAAVSLAGLEVIEPMPSHLRARIEDAADQWFADRESLAASGTRDVDRPVAASPGIGLFGWLGWAAAAAACIVLVFNLYSPTSLSRQTASSPTPSASIAPPSAAELRAELINSAPDIKRAVWGPGNVKELSSVSGDAVWSDAEQRGYLRFQGLPKNDRSKQSYQLWIFDETQSDKTPIDGGVFDVDSNGEVIIPIDAKLKVRNPAAFAVTIEKPGGVVVSDRSKIAVLGKVETSQRPSA
ncbi:MAG: anti-sigma factor domain-containing protein [Pyrinomonadaceae bacterium]